MSSIQYHSDQKTVLDIVNMYRNGQLDLNPGFQRSSVWSERDRAKLMNSILRNYPLPSIFLYERNTKDGNTIYDVIDGKQRIESILMFMGEMRGKRFRTRAQLTDESPEEWIDWNILKRRKLQHKITTYKLQAIEAAGEPGEIIELFVRINSTGKALTGQEKRNAKYFKSDYLKKAAQLAKRHTSYLRESGVLSSGQLSRMKHVELICELMVSAHAEDVTNKKAALDKIMESDSIKGRQLVKASAQTVTALNRLKRMFPQIKQTRFSKLSDFYSLAVLIQRLEREGAILTDRKRNRLAWDLLVAFSNGVDHVRLKQKNLENLQPGVALYREYLLTVLSGTDEINHRRERERVLYGLLASLFERKDSARLFSQEQRRILWNSTLIRRCGVCNKQLSWEDFTIDHIDPHSKGGRTRLQNAALMCRRHNAAKGNRRRAAAR